jgi:hypothetical protein
LQNNVLRWKRLRLQVEEEIGLLVALYTAIGRLVDDQMWAVRR